MTRADTNPLPGLVARLLPKSATKRAKAVYAALDAKSREHAERFVEIVRREYVPEKRVGKVEMESMLHVAPAVAPWIMDDPDGKFAAYFYEHLYGRIHGAGIPTDASRAVVEIVKGDVVAEVERLRRSAPEPH